MRTYLLKSGTVPAFEERFAEALPNRLKFSKLAACWHTAIGPLNQFLHIWPYQDMAERARIRAESLKLTTWPPQHREFLVRQENAIVVPAPFSPLH